MVSKGEFSSIGIVGLGYVGKAIASLFLAAEVEVRGYDISEQAIRRLLDDPNMTEGICLSEKARCGQLRLSNSISELAHTDAIIVCVPTPLDASRLPDLSSITDAMRHIASIVHVGQVIALESTTYPGTTVEICLPLLEESGLKESADFFLGFSPERVDPGRITPPLKSVPKVVGGVTWESTLRLKSLYEVAFERVIPVSDSTTAEFAKVLENAFRLVNIGFVNEMAQVAEKLDVDMWEVIEAAATKPFGYMPFYPSLGPGGHCIPVDPVYLWLKGRQLGVDSRLLEEARMVNESMLEHALLRLVRFLGECGRPLTKARILLAGIAYKPDVPDLRESTSAKFLDLLMRMGCQVDYLDPFVPEYHGLASVPSLSFDELSAYDAVVVCTNHSGFAATLYPHLEHLGILVFDTTGALRDRQISRYICLGIGDSERHKSPRQE